MRSIVVPATLISLEDNGFHLLIELIIFGQKSLAVLDTGASRSVFDKTLLDLHFPSIATDPETHATTLFSTSATSEVLIDRLIIGTRLKIDLYKAIGLDLSTVNETYKQLGHPEIGAIIGGDILVKYQAKIDYKKFTVTFYQ